MRNKYYLIILLLLFGCQNRIDLDNTKKIRTIYYPENNLTKPYAGVLIRRGNNRNGTRFLQSKFTMVKGIPNGKTESFDQSHTSLGTSEMKPLLDIDWLKKDISGITRINIERYDEAPEIHLIDLIIVTENLKVDSINFKSFRPTLIKKLLDRGYLRVEDTAHIYSVRIDDGEFPD
jgi:hypothetical protein